MIALGVGKGACMDDFSWELNEKHCEYDHSMYKLRLRKLLRDQEELSLEVIHLNNKRKFELTSMCIETTVLIVLFAFAFIYYRADGLLNLFSSFLLGDILAVPLLAHSVFCWIMVAKDEKKRKAGIERLQALEKEIDQLQSRVVSY